MHQWPPHKHAATAPKPMMATTSVMVKTTHCRQSAKSTTQQHDTTPTLGNYKQGSTMYTAQPRRGWTVQAPQLPGIHLRWQQCYCSSVRPTANAALRCMVQDIKQEVRRDRPRQKHIQERLVDADEVAPTRTHSAPYMPCTQVEQQIPKTQEIS